MDCSTPGLPVHHQLLEFTQTHAHWVGEAIRPSHTPSSPSPPAFNPSQHQGLFRWVSSSHQMAKVLEFQLQHQSFHNSVQEKLTLTVSALFHPLSVPISFPPPAFDSPGALSIGCGQCSNPVAAKSLQSYLTLCDPIDGSPPGSPVPGILQARTLEWVAISFSNAWKWKVKVKLLSHVRLLATPWTVAHQTPLSTGFSRQEYWSGVPLPSPYSHSK